MDKNGKSTFGANPEHLKRLLTAIGLDESNPDEQCSHSDSSTKPASSFMEQPGTRIGRYKLITMLGEGGMGIVYLAEQEEPIRRKVALKVIKPGLDSKRVIARFETERQTLAILDHPNIAHVYDAGTTESGRPYFVMEYVKGLPITEHCDEQKLTIDDRLKLFIQICHAIGHAHQKGIIHRDIKPSNILVSTQDDQAIPKIIDFGVAKALSQPLTEQTFVTEQGRLFGTPEYMSPEQADMAINDIDTRSDIYSLGVLLYVLLTGVLPFDSKELRKNGIENIRKIIRETSPKTPSTRLTKLGDEARGVAEKRRTEVAALAKCLHRELEWIPLKAMCKERTERYHSAVELADDIENYLKGNPLIAGPPGTVYRVKKFVQRHKALVAGAALVIIVLVTGIIVSTFLAIGQAHARAETQAVTDFLINDLLTNIRGAELQEPTASLLSDTFDNATINLEDKFRNQPLVLAEIYRQLGMIYRSFGDVNNYQQKFERAYELFGKHLGSEHNLTNNAAENLGWAYWYQGRYNDAIQLWSEQIEIMRAEYGEGHWRALAFMKHIGQTYTYLGRYEDAEVQLDKTLELCERSRSGFRVGFFLNVTKWELGKNYLAQGRYREAEQVLTEVLETWQGRTDWRAPECARILSEVYREQGQYEKAYKLCRTTLDTMSQELGGENQHTLWAMCTLGRILTDRNSLHEAEELLSNVLEIQRRKLGDEHDNTLESMNALAVVLTKREKYKMAEALFQEALKTRQIKRGGDHPVTLETEHDFGMLKMAQRQYQEAENLLQEAANGRIEKLGLPHPYTKESIKNLIELYEARNKPNEAKKWRAKLLDK